MKNGRFAFLSPLWGLRTTHYVHLWAHWKAHSGLPISLD